MRKNVNKNKFEIKSFECGIDFLSFHFNCCELTALNAFAALQSFLEPYEWLPLNVFHFSPCYSTDNWPTLFAAMAYRGSDGLAYTNTLGLSPSHSGKIKGEINLNFAGFVISKL